MGTSCFSCVDYLQLYTAVCQLSLHGNISNFNNNNNNNHPCVSVPTSLAADFCVAHDNGVDGTINSIRLNALESGYHGHNEVIVQMIVDVLDQVNFTNINLLYFNTDEARHLIDDLLVGLGRNHVQVRLTQLTGNGSAQMEALMDHGLYCWPLLYVGASSHIIPLIRQIRHLEQDFLEYYWLMLTPDELKLNETYWHEVLQDKDNFLFIHPTNEIETIPLSTMSLSNCGFGAGVNLNQQTHTSTFHIYSSYFRQIEKVGQWNRNRGLTATWEKLYLNQRPNFNNKTLKITTMEWAFFQKKVEVNNQTKWIGITIKILDELAKDLNFTYELSEPPDGNWGVLQSNGYFNGMVGLAQNRSVDLAGCALTINKDRHSVVDMTVPFFFDTTTAVINRPQESMLSKATIYIRPFHYHVWFCILACLPFYSLILWLVTKYSPFYTREGAAPIARGLFSFWNAALYLYGAMLTQGGVWLPEAYSGRFLVGFFWLYALVLVSTYSGNLVAFLTVSMVSMPFNNLEEMVQQTAYSWGCEKRGNLFGMFRDSDLSLYKKIFKDLTPLESYPEGHEMVKEGNFAFLTELTWYLDEHHADCNLLKMRDSFAPTQYGMALQKDSPYTKLFNQRILNLFESGLMDKWVNDWYTLQRLQSTSKECKALGPVASATEVEIMDFQGALILLMLGVVVGTGVFLIEFVIKLLKERRRQKKDRRSKTRSLRGCHVGGMVPRTASSDSGASSTGTMMTGVSTITPSTSGSRQPNTSRTIRTVSLSDDGDADAEPTKPPRTRRGATRTSRKITLDVTREPVCIENIESETQEISPLPAFARQKAIRKRKPESGKPSYYSTRSRTEHKEHKEPDVFVYC